MTTWAVKDHNGQILPDLRGSSRIEVGCRILPARYDAFRLHVSASYRKLFDRALQQVLEQNRWQMVEIKRRRPPVRLRNVVCDSYPAATRLGNAPAKRRDAMDALAGASPAELSFAVSRCCDAGAGAFVTPWPLRSTGLKRDLYPSVRRATRHRPRLV
jgi:hypothetical protein